MFRDYLVLQVGLCLDSDSVGLRTVPYHGYGRIFDGSRRVNPSCLRTVYPHTGNSNGTSTGGFTVILQVMGRI